MNPHELYALCNRHASHQHMGDDLMACRDWIPAAIECEHAATDELAELRATLAQLAAEADAMLNDEYIGRQYIAEHLVDRLTVLAGGGQ